MKALVEVLEGNKLIAIYMGAKLLPFKLNGNIETLWQECEIDNVNGCDEDQLYFHKDWNGLMAVVEKICRIKVGDGIVYVEHSYPRSFGMLNDETGQIMVSLNGFSLHQADTLIDACWEAVVEFIKWHNEYSR